MKAIIGSNNLEVSSKKKTLVITKKDYNKNKARTILSKMEPGDLLRVEIHLSKSNHYVEEVVAYSNGRYAWEESKWSRMNLDNFMKLFDNWATYVLRAG